MSAAGRFSIRKPASVGGIVIDLGPSVDNENIKGNESLLLREHRVSVKSSALRAKVMTEDANNMAQGTLEMLDTQEDQMDRIKEDADDIEANALRNRSVIKDMKRSFLVRLCCYGRQDVVPPEPVWHRDQEGEAKVKKIINQDKRRRAEQRRKKAAQESLSGSFFLSGSASKTQSLAAHLEDSSDPSSEDDLIKKPAAPKKEKMLKKIDERVTADEYDIDSDNFDEDIDRDLDDIHANVVRMKDSALGIKSRSERHVPKAEGLLAQVMKDKDQIKTNQKEGKSLLGRAAQRRLAQAERDEGGVLSLQDRMALETLKRSAVAKLG